MKLFVKTLNDFQLLRILQNIPSSAFNRVLNKILINLFKVKDKNNSDVVRLNQIMHKLLILRKFFSMSLANC